MSDNLCETCKTNPATKPHPCPFQEDLYGNYESLCTCCPECEKLCVDEI